MTGSRAAIVGGFVALCGVGLAANVLHYRDRSRPLPVAADRLLYLSSGQVANRVFLSFDALAADVYWMRAIQHYGTDRRSTRTSDRFALLQPLLDLTTTLDPHFNIAYRFGGILLSMEPPNGPNRLDQAIALVEKGLAHNPARWQYAHDIGFIHYWHSGNYREAAAWFARAGGMPNAPQWLGPLAAITLVQGGDRTGARRILGELQASEERYIRRAAERALAQLQALDDIDALQLRVAQFRADTGQYPASWSDLIRAGRLRAVPTDVTNSPYMYRSDAHTVTLSPESSLSPLPRALSPR